MRGQNPSVFMAFMKKTFFEKIISSFSEDSISFADKGKIFFIYFLTAIITFALPPLMIEVAIHKDYTPILILSIVLVSYWSASFFIHFGRKIRIATVAAATGTFIGITYAVVTGGHENYGYLFIYIVPYVSNYLLGYRRGLYANGAFFIFFLIVLFVPDIPFRSYPVNMDYAMRLAISYGILNAIAFSVITIQHIVTTKVEYLAFYDQLTNLPNRYQLEEDLGKAIQYALENKQPLRAILVNIDRFKKINDTYGAHIGDLILLTLSERLQEQIKDFKPIGGVGRFASADFLCYVVSDNPVESCVRTLQAAISRPVTVSHQLIQFSVSMGVAELNPENADRMDLLRNLDLALSQAKSYGPGSILHYRDLEHQDFRERFRMGEYLKDALKNGEIHLEYQPQIDIDNRKIFGLEVLLRWDSPEFGLVGPKTFIPLAEEEGLIAKISEWIIRTSWEELKLIEVENGLDLILSINLSPIHIQNPNFLQSLEHCMRTHQIDPRKVEFEITEGVLLGDDERIREVIKKIKQFGFTLSLDDFGTGYSSLSYLKKFCVDKLKIDQSFVHSIKSDATHFEIVKAIVAMARSLNLGVIAEGVEFQEQLTMIHDIGCPLFQGYYFSRPLRRENLARQIAHIKSEILKV